VGLRLYRSAAEHLGGGKIVTPIIGIRPLTKKAGGTSNIILLGENNKRRKIDD
jgi:hypothetical protein